MSPWAWRYSFKGSIFMAKFRWVYPHFADCVLIYQDTIHEMGIDPTKIRHSNTTFKGVTPGPGAHCTGSLLLKVIFGFPDNFRSKHLTFHIAPFQSGYQALLGREPFARFNAIPHYASLTIKMLGPCDIITVNESIK